MATSQAKSGDFIANLGKIYGCTPAASSPSSSSLPFSNRWACPTRSSATCSCSSRWLVYAGIGILSRTMQVSEYYVAGRRVPAIYNGMATGADWMSGASFVGMAGTLYMLGYDGLAFVLGWTGGYVLVAVLVAPFLRKFGAYTVPDFLSARFGGNFARFLGASSCCSAAPSPM
jgi:cation/acetate symporter